MTETPLHGLKKFSSSVINLTQPVVEKVLGGENEEKAFEVMGNILNILMDEPGDRYFGLTPSSKDKSAIKILFGFAEIESSFDVLQDIPFYLKHFPSKHPLISKTRFLNYHVGNYLNEVYILRERLRSYQKAITRMYKSDYRLREMGKHITKLDVLVSGFDNIVNVRGRHVHQERYDDEDFVRLKFYEQSVKMDDPLLDKLYSLALQVYRKKWVEKFSENNGKVKEILDAYFETLYDIVFDENGNWIEPVKSNSA